MMICDNLRKIKNSSLSILLQTFGRSRNYATITKSSLCDFLRTLQSDTAGRSAGRGAEISILTTFANFATPNPSRRPRLPLTEFVIIRKFLLLFAHSRTLLVAPGPGVKPWLPPTPAARRQPPGPGAAKSAQEFANNYKNFRIITNLVRGK